MRTIEEVLAERHQGDLISREALKKAFEEVYSLSTNEMGGVVNKRIYDIIDNAPTVEITDYDTGYQDGLEDGLNDIRPQGEWIETDGGTICNQCGNESRKWSNFCPNCGADMRGGRKC